MRRGHEFTTGEIYHLSNRGAHARGLFPADADRERFMLLLYLANTDGLMHVSNALSRARRKSLPLPETFKLVQREAEHRIVDVLAYVLMPNSFHLIVRQRVENGVTTFMRKVATGYSMYFNEHYEHHGVVFQGRFKSGIVENDSYLQSLFSYTHLIPLDFVCCEWRTSGEVNHAELRRFLEQYPFSSYLDYRSGGDRPESAVLSMGTVPDEVKKGRDFEELLQSARDAARSGIRL